MTNKLNGMLALGVLALAASLAPTGQARAEGRWCAESGGRSAYTNCGYYTFQQCLAAVNGVGGSCRPNPRYYAEPRYYR